MNLLALDTSSDACSVALQVRGEIGERHVIEAKQHAKMLIPMIRSLLDDADFELGSLDAIVLGNGPGSFIGMRIASSVAQGLAFASGLKIVPVSSMAAVAAEVMESSPATDVVVAQDARMNEAYLGIYRRNGRGLPETTMVEALQPIAAIRQLAEGRAAKPVAAGGAWQKYPGLLDLNRSAISQLLNVHYPRARCLLGLGAIAWQAGAAIEPENLMPAYIRTTVAVPPVEIFR